MKKIMRKMDWRVKPRILIVDDNEHWRQIHRRNLEKWGYEVYVAEGAGQALMADARAKAQLHQCHLALVDMCLLDDYGYDASGLEMVAQLHPTMSVMVSAYGTPTTAVNAVVEHGAVDFVGKEEGPHALQTTIQRHVETFCYVEKMPQLVWLRPLKNIKRSGALSDDGQWSLSEIEDVLTRLFPQAERVALDTLDEMHAVSHLAPRSQVMVFKAWVDDLQPVFVKVARAKRIEKEGRNYHEYIAGRLAGRPYARLENSVTLWNLGAVCYEFLDTSLHGMQTFTKYFASASERAVRDSLKRFFKKTWSKHFQQRRVEKRPLSVAYESVWGSRLRERLGRYVAEERPLSFLSINAPLINPIQWVYRYLQTEPAVAVACAVTHGDLHGDNMLVNENGQICVIDYERTGWGPIQQDFVQLETDILLRLADLDSENLLDCYKLYLAIAHPTTLRSRLPKLDPSANEATATARKLVQYLRKLAYDVTQIDDIRAYLWGVLLNTVFRATLLRRLMVVNHETYFAEYRRALLLGSVICQRLETIE